MPRKRDFDVLELPPAVWPRLALFEVLVDDPRRYRCRVHGSYLADVFREDLTGRYLVDEDIDDVSASATVAMLDAMRSSLAPQHYRGPTRFRVGEGYRITEVLLLPLADEAGAWRFTVGAANFPPCTPATTPDRVVDRQG